MTAKWIKLFQLLPGYDPIKTAGKGDWFDEKTADQVCGFFSEQLTHIEGELADKPFDLQPWQKAIVGCAFGWKRKDGTRRYREVLEYVPRKNGKSTMLGGLINLVAYCDAERGAQIYSAAAEREQAALVYRQAKGMILNNPRLSEGTKIYATVKSIEFPNGSIYKALSADANTKHGFNTHFVVVDELHAQPNRDLVDVLVTSTGSRKQPLVWYITTADYARESICNEKHDYASKVRDGVISDPSFLPAIYEATIDDDWKSPEVWRKANPNLGVSISLEYLRQACNGAQETPAFENTFKRLHLNIQTEQDVRWIGLDLWDICNEAVDEELLVGRRGFGGMDLSTKVDITAWCMIFPPTDDDPKWRMLPRFFAPQEGAERRERRDRVPYLTRARQGFITLTDGAVVDYEAVKAQITADCIKYQIQDIAYDPWNATQIALQLTDSGATMVEFQQGFRSMSEPTKELERLLIGREIAHGGNPVLRWMASNASVEIDPAGNLKPSKKKSTGRIDGIVATIMALGRAMLSDDVGVGALDIRVF